MGGDRDLNVDVSSVTVVAHPRSGVDSDDLRLCYFGCADTGRARRFIHSWLWWSARALLTDLRVLRRRMTTPPSSMAKLQATHLEHPCHDQFRNRTGKAAARALWGERTRRPGVDDKGMKGKCWGLCPLSHEKSSDLINRMKSGRSSGGFYLLPGNRLSENGKGPSQT